MKFTQTFKVRSAEMGPDYLLKKSELVRYFQETFALYCKEKNIAAFDVIKQGLVWVVSDMHVEFTGEMPFWSQEVRVEVWFSEISKLRMFTDFRMFYKDEEIARGDSCWFLLNSETRRPVSVTDVMENVESEPEMVFGEHTKHKFVPYGEKVAQKKHKVTFFDLDFNYHVNNLCYTSLASETVPIDYIKGHFIREFKVKFIKECFLDDELICEIYKQKDNFYGTLQKDGEDVCAIDSLWHSKINP